jgi:hypothetical protein
MAGDFVGWLLERGKVGGFVGVFIGLALIVGAIIDFQITGGFYLAMPGVGAIFLLIGGAVVVFDNPAVRGEFKEPTHRPLDEATARVLRSKQRPYLLCMACRRSTPFSPCMHCDDLLEVVNIESDEDLEFAMAAMES